MFKKYVGENGLIKETSDFKKPRAKPKLLRLQILLKDVML